MADDYLPVSGEELPTDAKIRLAEILSKDELEHLKVLQENIEKVLELGLLPAAIARLENIVSSLEKIAAHTEAIGDTREGLLLVSRAMEILKQEAARIGDAVNTFGSGAAELTGAKEDMNSAQAAMRETNIKISILADSLAEKLSEFQPGSIAGIEKGMHATVDLIREFMDYARERDTKVDNIIAYEKEFLDSISRRTDMIDEKFDDIKAEFSEAISKNAPVMEKISADTASMQSLVSAGAEKLERFAVDAEKIKATAETAETAFASLQAAQREIEETKKTLIEIAGEHAAAVNAAVGELRDMRSRLAEEREDTGNIKSGILAAADTLNKGTSAMENAAANMLTAIGDTKSSISASGTAAERLDASIAEMRKITDIHGQLIDAQQSGLKAAADRIEETAQKMDMVGEKAENLEAATRGLEQLKSDIDTRLGGLDNIRSQVSSASSAMEKTSETARETNETIKASSEALGGLLRQSGEFVSAQASATSELRTAAANTNETTATLKSLQEKLEETTKSVDRRTDDILNVMLSKTSELDRIAASLNANAAEIQSSASKLLAAANKLASLPIR